MCFRMTTTAEGGPSRKQQRVEDEPVPDEAELARIHAVMGFASFDSSKEKNHSGSDSFARRKVGAKRAFKQVVDKAPKPDR